MNIADAAVPHGLVQVKSSAYGTSGIPVPSLLAGPGLASRLTKKQIWAEYEKTKHHMEESGLPLIIISPKTFDGDTKDLPPDVIVVCGPDFFKHMQGFLTPVFVHPPKSSM